MPLEDGPSSRRVKQPATATTPFPSPNPDMYALVTLKWKFAILGGPEGY